MPNIYYYVRSLHLQLAPILLNLMIIKFATILYMNVRHMYRNDDCLYFLLLYSAYLPSKTPLIFVGLKSLGVTLSIFLEKD